MKLITLFLLCLFTLNLYANSPVDTELLFEQGITSFKEEKYKQAFHCWKKAASHGHNIARYNIGVVYLRQKNYQESISYWTDAAKMGDARSMYNLGTMYYNGTEVLQNYDMAHYWYVLAANRGHILAQYNLGTMYYNGTGVIQNYNIAHAWYEEAANLGNAWAQYNLGTMYYNGTGVLQNYDMAHSWYVLAANNRLYEARYALGIMYALGQGMQAPDINKAIECLTTVAYSGHSNAQYYLACIYSMNKKTHQVSYIWLSVASKYATGARHTAIEQLKSTIKTSLSKSTLNMAIILTEHLNEEIYSNTGKHTNMSTLLQL